ncbi:hypothetical protein X777_05678 [Ooceraea biroi]|uniref:Uncharacterized protein n=1 Tax=Ooceraea biroi TaxID=2015173 RepID=A0A026WEQ9_OOCBI|nr:hypothetical protein X777_05678 [Ooceraea biroi]
MTYGFVHACTKPRRIAGKRKFYLPACLPACHSPPLALHQEEGIQDTCVATRRKMRGGKRGVISHIHECRQQTTQARFMHVDSHKPF